MFALRLIENIINAVLSLMVSTWNSAWQLTQRKSVPTGKASGIGTEQIGTKESEIDYVKKRDDLQFFVRKPFLSDRYLIDMGQIYSLLPPPPATVIDLGCGPGWTSEFFAQRGYDVTGMDISADMIDIAKRYRRRGGTIEFMVGDYEFCSFAKKYDAAIFYDSLHHALDETAALKCAYEALRDGGRLIICEPGVGHGHSETSVEAARKYGTTEKDMPPSKTMPILRALGFRNMKVIMRLSLLGDLLENKTAWRQLIALQSAAPMDHGVVVAEK
jgi:SAM-dependent methyltransferase